MLLRSVLGWAQEQGAVIVASAGNQFPDAPVQNLLHYPAAFTLPFQDLPPLTNLLAVAALSAHKNPEDDVPWTLTSFAMSRPYANMAALGEGLLSGNANDGATPFSPYRQNMWGSSFSAAQVSGGAALWLARMTQGRPDSAMAANVVKGLRQAGRRSCTSYSGNSFCTVLDLSHIP